MFAIPRLCDVALNIPIPAQLKVPMSRDEHRIAADLLLVGVGAGVVSADEFARAAESECPSYAIGRLAGDVCDRLARRAIDEIREALGLDVSPQWYGLSLSGFDERTWLLDGSDSMLVLEGFSNLPKPVQESIGLCLSLIDRLLVPSIWPVDLAHAWSVAEMAEEWGEICRACGTDNPEAVAALFPNGSKTHPNVESYLIDPSDLDSCRWAAMVHAVHNAKLTPEDPLYAAYAPTLTGSVWSIMGKLEALSGAFDGPLRDWCRKVAGAVRWHTGGPSGLRRLRRLVRQCGYEESDEHDEGVVPLAHASYITSSGDEMQIAEDLSNNILNAGEYAGTFIAVQEPLCGGLVLYHKLRGCLTGRSLLMALGDILSAHAEAQSEVA